MMTSASRKLKETALQSLSTISKLFLCVLLHSKFDIASMLDRISESTCNFRSLSTDRTIMGRTSGHLLNMDFKNISVFFGICSLISIVSTVRLPVKWSTVEGRITPFPSISFLCASLFFFTCCFGTICDKMGGWGTYRHIFERHEVSLLTPFSNLSLKGESPEQLKMASSSCNTLVLLYNHPLCPSTFVIVRLYSKLTRTSFPCENIHHMEDHASKQN